MKKGVRYFLRPQKNAILATNHAYIFLGSLRSSCLTVLDETLKVTATTQRAI